MNAVVRRRVVAGSVSAYRRLCACYPPAFRARYEEEMVALFADLCDEASGRGVFAMLGLWCRALIDLGRTTIAVQSLVVADSRLAGLAAAAMIGVVPMLSLVRVLSHQLRPDTTAIQVSAVFVHCVLMYTLAQALGRAVVWARLAMCLALASVLVQAAHDRQSFAVLFDSGPAIMLGVAQISIPVVMILAVFGALQRAISPRTP